MDPPHNPVLASPRKAKRHKKTYFFQPSNSLMGRASLGSVGALSVEKSTENRPEPAIDPSITPFSGHLSTGPSSPRVDVTLQSSDDSYDGIKWRTTPRKAQYRPHGSATVPSSPLKEVRDSTNSERKTGQIKAKTHASATLPDEQANSVLSKYGTDFVNISSQPSSSPHLHKTTSELSTRTRKSDVSPVLQRSRSSGVERLAQRPALVTSKSTTRSLLGSFATDANEPVESRPGSTLNSWISRFGGDAQGGLDFSKLTLFQAEQPSSPAASEIAAIDFSDFSDSEVIDSDPVRRHKTPETDSKTPETESDPFSSDDEMFQNLGTTTEPPQGLPDSRRYDNDISLAVPRQNLSRYKILDFRSTTFTVHEKSAKQLVMTVVDNTGSTSKLLVRGEASRLNFEKGDFVHIIITAPFNPRLVDDDHNLLIWNPDTLVSPTAVSQQLGCARKSVLTARFKFPGVASIHLVTGTILHEVFQSCIRDNNWTIPYMNELVESLVYERRVEIYSLGENMTKEVKGTISDQLPYLHEWFEKYYKKLPSNTTIIQSAAVPTATSRQLRNKTIMFAVSRALDIEETIWSPMFGLNGKVDVTIEAQLRDQGRTVSQLMPLEIKTGREHISHHAQSALYTLLFKDRYELDLSAFLLVYTKEKITKKEEITRNDLKSLVNLRNQITEYFKLNTRKLPQLLNLSLCDRCEIQSACMTINYLAENGTGEDCGIGLDNYSLLVDHLTEKDKQFYNLWDTVITKEESSMSRLKRELWLRTSTEREETSGRCISNLIATECNVQESGWFEYSFRRADNSPVKRSFQLGQLSRHDRVIVSSENGHYALSQGYITRLRKDSITISAMRKISPPSIGKSGQYRQEIQESGLQFRIDKDEMFYGMGLARFNILNMFLEDGDSQRRDILVNRRRPQFTNTRIKCSAPLYLNVDQKTAIEKVLLADDFALILGMPGTGKTTVISELIKLFVSNGKSVLLTSYTHSAVDNILLKLKDGGLNILRVGSSSKVHPEIQAYLPAKVDDYESFRAAYVEPQVVATTCLGIDDIAFSLGRTFDYCILDEASQVTMPVSLGPLRFCKKFVLVGDHHQLPPLVQHPDPEVRDHLSTSLFRTLGENFPESMSELSFQFRMCEDIMLLSNVLVYENRLKCGSPEVADSSLHIPEPQNVAQLLLSSTSLEQERWMDRILDPQNKVLFINHDDIPGYETVVGDKIENTTESRLVFQIVEALTLCGISESQIGVMTLYRSQLRLLMKGLSTKRQIECLTADQFQGRDKDCVVISLVRSNKELRVGDLLKEWRRINVAITRSRTKLIILGSSAVMRSIHSLSKVMALIESRGWSHTLLPNALSIYKEKDIVDSPQKPRPGFQRNSVAGDVFNQITN